MKEVDQQEEVLLNLQTKLFNLKAVISDRKKQVHNPEGEENLVEWGEANVGHEGGEDKSIEIGEETVAQIGEENICQSWQKKFGQPGNDMRTPHSTHPKALPIFLLIV